MIHSRGGSQRKEFFVTEPVVKACNPCARPAGIFSLASASDVGGGCVICSAAL